MRTSGLISALRSMLTLGRVSALPTVWSNCLAGWWLGGGGHREHLPLLFAGGTFLYLGGTFLNDAFDADSDREHRPTRPIPSGKVSQHLVWRWGLAWLVLGALSLLWLGSTTGSLGLALVVGIILYNTVHKLIAYAPVLMGLCRLLVYLIGASVANRGVTGWSVWCGLALAIYVIGLRSLARHEGKPAPPPYWPVFLLIVPVILALIMDVDGYREDALLLSAVLLLWVLRSLRRSFWSLAPSLGATVSGLVAGIVFVDWLAVAEAPRELSAAFIGLFLVTLVLQRLVPAA